MGLSFLVPAFLAGLVALGIPVLIHLTRRERTAVVEFPSLMFLQKLPYETIHRRRIRHWLLLVLRCVALALVVAAFARPFLDRPTAAAMGRGGPGGGDPAGPVVQAWGTGTAGIGRGRRRIG